MDLIEHTRQTLLQELINLFAASRSHLRAATREIAVVVEGSQGRSFALAVDTVDSTESLPAEDLSSLPNLMARAETRFLLGVAKRRRDKHMILLLDVDPLYDEGTA